MSDTPNPANSSDTPPEPEATRPRPAGGFGRPAHVLPRTVNELLPMRKGSRTRTLNDDVEDIHLRLFEDPHYREFLEPIWREETVEGSFIADDLSASMMIRQYAKEHNNAMPFAARAKLQSIMRSLHIVCRRYGLSRKERQMAVGSEIVDLPEEAVGNY